MNEVSYQRYKSVLMLLMVLFVVHIQQAFPANLSNYESDLKVVFTMRDLVQSKSLKKNDIVRVLGYYNIDDGGGAEYIIRGEQHDANRNNDYYIELENGLKAYLLKPETINYRIFGAKGDGINNDAVQIAKAHAYANEKNIPVVNLGGEFWLKEIVKINIQTDVNWGKTIFHIDERYNSLTNFRFEITSKNKPIDIELTDDDKKELLNSLKPGRSFVPILERYKNHFVVISDSNDRIAYRSGSRFQGQSKSREDFFYVEESGKIIGEITWEFTNFTKLIAYPVDKNYQTVEGGVFYLSGDSPSSEKGYYKNGISISRSKTIVTNQWIGLEPGREDTITINPRSGFYSFSNVYDITLENARLFPYLQIRSSGRNVSSGTYGISMGRVLRSRFKNVVAEGSREHWGIFGTNLNKDFRIEDCILNRVDVHYHCWNLFIIGSQIGDRGITVTGGGNLFIENSSCSGQNFINFRSDYGSKWDGDIKIKNCTFKVNYDQKDIAILKFSPQNFDYKYPIRFGKNILIENLSVDFNNDVSKDAPCWLIKVPKFSVMKNGENIHFPDFIQFENIKVIGREKGLRLFSLADQSGYRVDKRGGYNNDMLVSNAMFYFKNVQLENLSNEKDQFHFMMDFDSKNRNEYALYPTISFTDCNNLAIHYNGNQADILFDNCSISNISGNKNNPLKGRFIFSNSQFWPIIKKDIDVVYSLNSLAGTFFSNCIIYPPVYQEERRIDLIDRTGIFRLNQEVFYNHNNTILNRSIIDYYRDKIDPLFLHQLQHNYQPETNVFLH